MQFHEIYSSEDTRSWVKEGCTTAGIGCVECKQPVIDAVELELQPIRERANEYLEDASTVQSIIKEGSEEARDVARDTLDDVREAVGLS